MAPKTWLAAVL